MSGKNYKLILLTLIVAMMAKNVVSLKFLNRTRAEAGLTRTEPLENAPPVLAFTTVALGGFRGLISNYLWFRTTSLQYEGKFFETLSLASWITKLQPTFTTVWENQAWNMTYNISREFDNPTERWLWINSGIELLRDEALVYNPHEPSLYRELAWFYLDKIGTTLDDQHYFYKETLANIMVRLTGPSPDYNLILNPQTPEQKEAVSFLREKLKLQPEAMARVDQDYGPLDWRLPETHAIYWASIGLERCKGKDVLPLKRVIYQSLQLAFQRGRILENPVDKTLDFAPNLEIAQKLDETFVRFREEETDNPYVIDSARSYFMQEAVYFNYLYMRREEAARWFQKLVETFPGVVDPNLDLESFVSQHVQKKADDGSNKKVRAIIDGMLTTSYYRLALGDAESSVGHALLAGKIHKDYNSKILSEGAEHRLLLPSFEELKKNAILRALSDQPGSFSEEMKLRLKTALQLPADWPNEE